MIRRLRKIVKALILNSDKLVSKLSKIEQKVSKMQQQLVHSSYEEIRSHSRYKDKKSLVPYGYKVYSQNDEDGIICEIFRRIGVTNKMFVELGVGIGLESNTLALLFDGWKGIWIEASENSTRRIRKNFKSTIESGVLGVINSFITMDNIDELISSEIDDHEIDLLSIDIDGNDVHIFKAINCIRPRVVVIEYNPKFPPPIKYCMSYDKDHVWNGDDNMGASLKHLEIEFAKKSYCLVGCSLTGINAFFVRKDLVGTKFLESSSAEVHFEPARYYLTPFYSGHTPSFLTLERSLK